MMRLNAGVGLAMAPVLFADALFDREVNLSAGIKV